MKNWTIVRTLENGFLYRYEDGKYIPIDYHCLDCQADDILPEANMDEFEVLAVGVA